jgi:hypothetical protein
MGSGEWGQRNCFPLPIPHSPFSMPLSYFKSFWHNGIQNSKFLNHM